MRLLVVDEEVIAGGVETLRRQLMPALAKRIEQIVWVLPAYVAEAFRGVADGCENIIIETLTSPRGMGRLKEAVAKRVGTIPRHLVDERLQHLARKYRSDLCMTTCIFGQEIPRLELPVVGFVSDINPELPQHIRDNIANWVEHTAATFAVSEFTCAELKRLRPEYSEKIHAIPLAPPERVKPSNHVTAGSFYYPAAPNQHKGHLTLLDAARGLAVRGIDYRLTFTGPGMNGFAKPGCGNQVIEQMRAFLEAHRALLDGRITIAGDARAPEVERLFAEASCVVLPSSYEGFGLPLAEALAYGKQVICADIAPFREQIKRHGCECLATFVPPGDSAALELAMAAHLTEKVPGLTPEQLSERLSRWTWADAAQRCMLYLEKVIRHG